jgi:hypothetical protein
MRQHEFREVSAGMKNIIPALKWVREKKKYMASDSKVKEMDCITDGLCKPLLPKQDIDDLWQKIYSNCSFMQKKLQKLGGSLHFSHFLLPDKFTVNVDAEPVPRQIARRTVFASGFLVPRNKISALAGGFYIRGDQMGDLDNIAAQHKNSIVSNFAYFFTPELVSRPDYGYNTLRPEDEHLPKGLSPFLGGFAYDRGDFPPLFNRGGIGFIDNKVFVVSSWNVKRCTVFISRNPVEVNSVNVPDTGQDAILYTPKYTTGASLSEEKKVLEDPNYTGWMRFAEKVGNGRVNIVVSNRGNGEYPVPEIVYCRFGEIIMPSCCAVVSFSRKKFIEIFPDIKISEGSYLDRKLTAGIDISFKVNPPEEVSEKEWKNISFFYSGLHPLMAGGKNFAENMDTIMENMYEHYQLHPRSLQAQETYIPNPFRREPRCLLVQTNDDKIGIFTFSGRYECSVGANYFEVMSVLKKIHGDNLKNVFMLDSGSAVKLGYVDEKGETQPLMLPSIGVRNYIGNIKGNVYSLLFFRL